MNEDYAKSFEKRTWLLSGFSNVRRYHDNIKSLAHKKTIIK